MVLVFCHFIGLRATLRERPCILPKPNSYLKLDTEYVFRIQYQESAEVRDHYYFSLMLQP